MFSGICYIEQNYAQLRQSWPKIRTQSTQIDFPLPPKVLDQTRKSAVTNAEIPRPRVLYLVRGYFHFVFFPFSLHFSMEADGCR